MLNTVHCSLNGIELAQGYESHNHTANNSCSEASTRKPMSRDFESNVLFNYVVAQSFQVLLDNGTVSSVLQLSDVKVE